MTKSNLLISLSLIFISASLTFAFTGPTNGPTNASSSINSLIDQMAGTSFNPSTDSLESIANKLTNITSSGSNVGIGVTAPTDKLEVDGAIVRNGFFQGVVGTAQTHASTAELNHNFTVETRKDTDYYSHSTSTNPDQITIIQAGWYKITYQLSWDSDTADRVVVRAYVEDDGAEISPSDSYAYTRQNTYGRHGSTGTTFIANIGAGSVIEVHSQIYNTTGNFGETADIDSIANEGWILIEKI